VSGRAVVLGRRKPVPFTPAELVLRELGIEDPADIDLEAIAWHRGVRVKYRSLDDCEARIFGLGEKAVITVDDRHGPKRARYSVGHELGHWHHHRGKTFICRPEDIAGRGPVDPAGRPIPASTINPERVADGYSADLLMPNYLFASLAGQQPKLTLKSVEDLADVFGTSFTATAIKMIDAGPVPAILVCHGPAGRRWFRRHRDVPERWFPQETLNPDSYAADVLAGKVERSRQVKIGADAWFDRFDASRYELIEQSMRIGEDVLSFLIIEDGDMLEESGVGPRRW
jgi:Zn-dependent peptidase ImmA (M78 family)